MATAVARITGEIWLSVTFTRFWAAAKVAILLP